MWLRAWQIRRSWRKLLTCRYEEPHYIIPGTARQYDMSLARKARFSIELTNQLKGIDQPAHKLRLTRQTVMDDIS
jgi:hypothetical protein